MKPDLPRSVLSGAVALHLLAAGAAVGGPRSQAVPAVPSPPRSVTLPMTLDHNRMVVEVELVRPDGTIRRARAWVDTGSQYVSMTASLARELGLALPAGTREGNAQPPTLAIRLRNLPLDLTGIELRVHTTATVKPGVAADLCLPASALRGLQVVFDYPERRMTVARPGSLELHGVAVPCRVNRDTGLFMIPAVVDGEAVALGVDTGSAGTWISEPVVAAWLRRHPELPHAVGAAGSANFFGFDFEPNGVLMRLPELRIGGLPVRDVALLGLDQSLFDWYSRKSAGTVVGFIGANVLRRFRVAVDFPNATTYWQPGPSTVPNDLDIVGLTLRPEAEGGFAVAGVVTRNGAPAVPGIQAGDRLVSVDGHDAAGLRMGAVVDALRGRPGATRTLVVEREGTRITVAAKVERLP